MLQLSSYYSKGYRRRKYRCWDSSTTWGNHERNGCTDYYRIGQYRGVFTFVIRKWHSLKLLKQRPMLLPQVYKKYCTAFHEAASSHTYSLAVAPESVVSTRYLLSYLVTRVGKHLQYTMKQRSAGTLLYRRGSDPLLMLTKVLHRERSGLYHHPAQNKMKDETETNSIPNHMHNCH